MKHKIRIGSALLLTLLSFLSLVLLYNSISSVTNLPRRQNFQSQVSATETPMTTTFTLESLIPENAQYVDTSQASQQPYSLLSYQVEATPEDVASSTMSKLATSWKLIISKKENSEYSNRIFLLLHRYMYRGAVGFDEHLSIEITQFDVSAQLPEVSVVIGGLRVPDPLRIEHYPGVHIVTSHLTNDLPTPEGTPEPEYITEYTVKASAKAIRDYYVQSLSPFGWKLEDEKFAQGSIRLSFASRLIGADGGLFFSDLKISIEPSTGEESRVRVQATGSGVVGK